MRYKIPSNFLGGKGEQLPVSILAASSPMTTEDAEIFGVLSEAYSKYEAYLSITAAIPDVSRDYVWAHDPAASLSLEFKGE